MPSKNDVYVGIDLGGTSIKALAVDARHRILAEEKLPTRASLRPDRVIGDIAGLVIQAVNAAGRTRHNLRGVGIGAPGAIDPKRGVVHEAPNLGWKEVPLGRDLKKLLRVPVMVDNDVNVGVMGEHALGAGGKTQEMVGIWVGTGIGGGIISRGKLYEGSHGGAGEVGHTVLVVDGPVCSCGRRGHAEALASRTAMERDVRAAIKAGRKSVVLDIMKRKNKPRMTSSVIHAALKKHDPLMREVMQRAEYYLGVLVSNMVNLLGPERVVIGGGLAARLGESFVAPIRATALEYFLRPDDLRRVKVVPAALGDNAGALGAVILARQRLG
ncbi:MAG TPA: ROK family protein [Terriglobia bacterium]|nr:ROK family protein [Terriglobia bacterium]